MSKEIAPTNKHIGIDNDNLIKFAKTIRQDKELVSIQCKPSAIKIGFCYWDVEMMVSKNGGDSVHGWLFTEWPGSHIEAMHHAVYRNADGDLVDICPKLSGYNQPTLTTFLEDDSIKVDLDKVPAIINRFYVYDNNIFTRNFIKTYTKKIKLTAMNSELYYKLGYRCEGQRSLVRGQEPEFSEDLVNKLQSQQCEELGLRIKKESDKLGKNIKALKKHLGQ